MVTDSRKRKIRGLWRRGNRYYAQMRMEVEAGRTEPKRIALSATTLDQARAELEKVRSENRSGTLTLPGRQPRFSEFADEYLVSAIHGQKKPGTRKAERQNLRYWKVHLGAVQLGKITAPMVKAYLERRLSQGVSARTINIELVAFYAVLKLAVDRGVIPSFVRVRQLRQKPPPKRTLVSSQEIERLIAACRPEVTKNADLLRFYLRFLALSGAREKEALRVRWSDVDFTNRQVTIGASGESKTGRHRTVNLSREFEELLSEMNKNRQPDSSFLFPSPQRGSQDLPARTMRESFRAVRKAAHLPHLNFHDMRHHFASVAVMGGIDFMTIASWLGHSDGGILVGKVYGHLADAHKARMADGLSILRSPANVIALPSRQG